TVYPCELLERRPVDVVLPQQRPLTVRQCPQRDLESALELPPIELLHVIEHKRLGRDQVLPKLVVVRRLLAASSALASHRLTRRHDAHPAAQVTASREIDDLRVVAVTDENTVPDLLLDFGDNVATDPDPAQSAIELAEAALLEHDDRVGVAV